jgi:polyisoprenoid-binding protein YceI
MPLAAGTYVLGPQNASLQVKTYREGMAAKVGHDLVFDVGRWDATLDVPADPADSTIALHADPHSLQVREGLRGVKPLTDKDRAEIRKNIEDKVLHGQPIAFRARRGRLEDDGARLVVEGDLTMAGNTRPITAPLRIRADGQIGATIPLTQSAWGIKPYRGLMGALKVRDELEVLIEARLPRAAG